MTIPRAISVGFLLAAAASDAGSQTEEDRLLQAILAGGRLELLGVTSQERLRPLGTLAPGDPPVLAFRYLEDRRRHRFGELDLMMDDAGH